MKTDNHLKGLERQVKLLKKERDKAAKIENQTSEAWKKKWGPFLDALDKRLAADEARIAIYGGMKEEVNQIKLMREFHTYTKPSSKLKRDAKAKKEALDMELRKLASEISMIKNVETDRRKVEDQIVVESFRKNDAVNAAVKDRDEYNKKVVYPYVDQRRNGSTEPITLRTLDDLRQLTISQATKVTVSPDVGHAALNLISAYYARIQEVESMDQNEQAIYKMTRAIFSEKKTFKPGKMFSSFISMPFDRDIMPEFVEAQELLKQGIRSDESATRTKLTQRPSPSEKPVWVNKH